MIKIAQVRSLLFIFFALSFCAGPAYAGQYGNWVSGVMEGNEGYFAASINDSNGVFGQYCYAESDACIWILATDIDCKEERRYPNLVHADYGAEQLEIVCRKLGKTPRYIFMDFDKINATITRSKSYVGFAFPLESGLFQVNRFLLDGADEAMKAMHANFRTGKKPKKNPGTKNYQL